MVRKTDIVGFIDWWLNRCCIILFQSIGDAAGMSRSYLGEDEEALMNCLLDAAEMEMQNIDPSLHQFPIKIIFIKVAV